MQRPRLQRPRSSSSLHGSPITAEEIERIVSREFSPHRFASLCNAISWVASGRNCDSLPSFTERVNAKDGGIDAEWQIALPKEGKFLSPLLGPGWNIFQYKQRDIFAQGRAKTLAALAIGLRGAAKGLMKGTGRAPSRYVLFTNLDLTHVTKGQKGRLKRNILDKWPANRKIQVEIVGAGELAALINAAPAVRSAFFCPAAFSTWQEAWQALTKAKLYGGNVRLVGRERELQNLRSFLADPAVRAIVLAGPHDMGKSRLALEATQQFAIRTVIAVDPRSMAGSDLLALASPPQDTIVIIEDPEVDRAEDFVHLALARDDLKLIITLPVSSTAPVPSFGRENRAPLIRLEPLKETQSEELLAAAGARFDYGLQSWVIHQAGGNPGILLYAASVGATLRGSATSFAEEVAQAFERKVVRVLGEESLKTLRLLSVMTYVGFKGNAGKELELVSRLFGEGISPNAVRTALPKLAGAGVVRLAGAYLEVTPPLFASFLATSALQARFALLFELFGSLSQPGRLRLIRRLRDLKGEEVSRFWDEMFGPAGLFSNLRGAMKAGRLLQLIAGSVPDRVTALLEEGLQTLSREARLTIKDEERRNLVWALEELLFRSKTSASAVRCLALLGEAENERYGNSATGLFCESFFPLHPQMPASLEERLGVLQRLLNEPCSPQMRALVARAIDSAFQQSGAVTLRRSEGAEPLDTRPSLTYGEVWDYLEALINLLKELAGTDEGEAGQVARTSLPHAIASYAIGGRPERAMHRLKEIAEYTISERIRIPVPALTDALAVVKDAFEKHKLARSDEAAKYEAWLGEIDRLRDAFDQGSFALRLRRWAGGWGRHAHEFVEEGGRRVYRSEKEMQRLGKEAAENPHILTEELFSWLRSPSAQRGHGFFYWLGKHDSSRRWLEKIEACVTDRTTATIFAAYFGGLGTIDREFVSNRLDALTRAESVPGEAIVRATGYLGGDAAGVSRVRVLIEEGRVDPVHVEGTLSCGGWIDSLQTAEYLDLLRAIAGPQLEHAAAAIDFLGMWMHDQRPIQGELADFAWACLESVPKITANEDYDCDQLAAHLARSDMERGFRLLDRLLTSPPDRDTWNPLSPDRERRFLSALLGSDRDRVLRLAFSLGVRDAIVGIHITWDLREILDQERDIDTLVALALESQEQAAIISSTITAARPGFWPIALRILQAYPNNERIRGNLAGGIEHLGLLVDGPLSAHYEACRQEVARIRANTDTPRESKSWLKSVEEQLRTLSEQQLRSEIEEDINDLRQVVEDPAAPERLWAIDTLLRLGKVKEVVGLIGSKEVAAVLRKTRLPAREKQKIRRLLREE